MIRPVRAQTSRWLAAALCLLCAMAGSSALAQDDADELLKLPGLVAEFSNLDGALLFRRLEPIPAFALGAEETLDSRLPARGWMVTYRGVLDVQQPGKYRFAAEATGPLRITIGEEVALDTEVKLDRELELTVGYHPLVIEFTPAAGPARLSIDWQSSAFPREPLSAFAVGRMPNQSVADEYLAGRLAVEEHSCVACHQPSNDVPLSLALGNRSGPRLKESENRLSTAWIAQWLADPTAHRPEAVMPRLFSDDRAGEIERYAIAKYLTRGSDEAIPAESVDAKQIDEGRALYERTGCVICHEKQTLSDETEIAPKATLANLSAKGPFQALADFIHDPYLIDPSGRMPKFGLSKEQAQAIAAYLRSRGNPVGAELPAAPSTDELNAGYARLVIDESARATFAKQSAEAQLDELARQSIRAKRCANCHEFGGDDLAAAATQSDFAAIAKSSSGCLVNESNGAHPRFGQSLDREKSATFLASSAKSPGIALPIEEARLVMARLNCTGCHERNGEGGLSASLAQLLTESQTSAEAELIRPPTLSGITQKLRAEALAGVLKNGQRSRPWMALKMPQFSETDVAKLLTALPAMEAHLAPETTIAPTPDANFAAAGRTLVGSQGFGCIKCHDIRGIPSGGTRGPDLAQVANRIQPDWYRRWMADPQRLEPGTRMPTVFFGGQSPYKTILDGDPHRQGEAIWAYLSAGNDLELPEGLEAGGRQTLESKAPLVMRTFLPDVSPRALAIQFPSGVHAAYDAQTCRVAYVWRGEFLDLNPVWTGRGGRPANPLGERVWTGPAGFPWVAKSGDDKAPPDFTAQAASIELGAMPPDDGQFHPTKLHFRGYRLNEGNPALLYDLQGDENVVAIEESISTTDSDSATGVLRRFVVRAKPGARLWFAAATSRSAPSVLVGPDAKQLAAGESVAANQVVFVERASDHAVVAQLPNCSAREPRWFALQQGDAWVLALACQATEETTDLSVLIEVLRHGQTK